MNGNQLQTSNAILQSTLENVGAGKYTSFVVRLWWCLTKDYLISILRQFLCFLLLSTPLLTPPLPTALLLFCSYFSFKIAVSCFSQLVVKSPTNETLQNQNWLHCAHVHSKKKLGKHKGKIKNLKKVTCQDCTVCVQYICKIRCKVSFFLAQKFKYLI